MNNSSQSVSKRAERTPASVIRLSSAGLTVGTSVMTPAGLRFVEDLKRGDRILTKDFGYQQLKCIGFRQVDLTRSYAQAPIRLAASSLGHERPLDGLYVSPSQQLALRHPLFEPLFGRREVVAKAGDLQDLPGVEQVRGLTGITYVSLGFARPQLVLTGSMVLDVGPDETAPTRPVLSAAEARLACGMLTPRVVEMPANGHSLH